MYGLNTIRRMNGETTAPDYPSASIDAAMARIAAGVDDGKVETEKGFGCLQCKHYNAHPRWQSTPVCTYGGCRFERR